MNNTIFAARHHELVGAPAISSANARWPGAAACAHWPATGEPSLRQNLPKRTASSRARAASMLFTRLLDMLQTWRRSSRHRSELSGLDDRMLRDIGLTREWLAADSSKFFWQE